MPTIINQFDVEMPNPARPSPGAAAAPASPPPASRLQPVAVRDLLVWLAARERRLLEY